jgi:hypothetical protein
MAESFTKAREGGSRRKCCTAHNAAGHEIQDYELRRLRRGGKTEFAESAARSARAGFQRSHAFYDLVDTLVKIASRCPHDHHHGGRVAPILVVQLLKRSNRPSTEVRNCPISDRKVPTSDRRVPTSDRSALMLS